MRKETTNKPKKEPFLILTRTKFENKSRRRITNILKKNSQENSKDQKNTQTKNSNKASEAKHKENEHNTKIPATKCILQNCKQQQQRFKKTRERGTKSPMTRPHAQAPRRRGGFRGEGLAAGEKGAADAFSLISGSLSLAAATSAAAASDMVTMAESEFTGVPGAVAHAVAPPPEA